MNSIFCALQDGWLSSNWFECSFCPLCCLKGLGVFLADLPTSHTQEKKTKTMLPGVGFFKSKKWHFLVFYKKFDWIILKILNLLLFNQSVRETYGRQKERLVNWRGRRRVPLDDTMVFSKRACKNKLILMISYHHMYVFS